MNELQRTGVKPGKSGELLAIVYTPKMILIWPGGCIIKERSFGSFFYLCLLFNHPVSAFSFLLREIFCQRVRTEECIRESLFQGEDKVYNQVIMSKFIS
jgi:hypothetical protein